MKWISLSDRYPEAKHSIPNEECRCTCCDHEVSDWVRVRTERMNERSIRWRPA